MQDESTKLINEDNVISQNVNPANEEKKSDKKKSNKGVTAAAVAGAAVVGGVVGAAIEGNTANAAAVPTTPKGDAAAHDEVKNTVAGTDSANSDNHDNTAANDTTASADAHGAGENSEDIIVPKPEDVLLENEEGIRFAHVQADNFRDAFIEAREQVGPGGIFEFDGKIYTTYYPQELSELSPEERNALHAAIQQDEMEVPNPEDVLLVNEEGIRFAHVDADTFNEAFRQARAQVGPGGVFEFQGKLYGTYLADEWDAMTRDEKLAFQADVFGESAVPRHTHTDVTSVTADVHNTTAHATGSDVHHTTAAVHHTTTEPHDVHNVHHTTASTPVTETHVHVHHHHDVTVHNEHHVVIDQPVHFDESELAVTEYEPVDPILEVTPVDDEIRVLGVETVDTGDGLMNVAAVSMGDDPALLVDIDNDGYIEVGIHDDNYDGQIDASEIHDISDANIHVDDLANMAEYQDTDSYLASEDPMYDNPFDQDPLQI